MNKWRTRHAFRKSIKDDIRTHETLASLHLRKLEQTDKRKRRIATGSYNAADAQKQTALTSMNDHQFMANQETRDNVLFGVYGLDDWVCNTFMKEAIENNMSTIASEGTWIVPNGWKLTDWVQELNPTQFNFMSASRALVKLPACLLEVGFSRGKLSIEINGFPADVAAFINGLDAQFKRAENLIEWIYNERGDSISVPLNYRPALPHAYPWLTKPIEEYINDYMNSDASVLILLGPPGTGKTTFIKNLVHHSGANAKITYDERVMNGDSLFANFIEDDSKFLIMEDADAFLKSREDGNTMMHRFLNVSDGLISAKDKKLVFSTNLPSIRDVDSALIRPGRCFDVVEFRAFTRSEAELVAGDLNVSLPDGNEFTLAEMFNKQPSSDIVQNRRVGFV